MTSVGALGVAGMTVQVHVPVAQLARARDFYTGLFGRPPDFAPHDDFLEWATIEGGECWFQVVGRAAFEPLRNRVCFRVEDIDAARGHVRTIGAEAGESSRLPGVVAFVDFSDPWGNALGLYEDLEPSGQQATYPGTTVHDESLYES